jgi:cell division protein FtsL
VGVWAFLLALCTAGALTHVGVRMHSIQIAYALGKERKTNTQLQEQRRRLNIEIGMLKAPERIIGMARDELAMGPPAQSDVVRLGPGVTLQPAAAVAPAPPPAKPGKLPAKTKVKP